MKIRVVQCDDESHDLGWVLAKDCSHWSLNCPRSKKAKKPRHKFTKDDPGYLVAIVGDPPTGVMGDTWLYAQDRPAWALELSEKRFTGHWCPGNGHGGCKVRHNRVDLTDDNDQAGVFVRPVEGLLFECVTGCGFLGAE